ncbi:hypothetical protein [Ornithinibacillus scapharcae]|uniref:hypothetical protein n=1 Tax=Ornithinibacillus scapharcae TaxID=1147159 RepID=UPI000225B046|nr:hypothetical protein [Ornithinibacillus scapharcae]
MTYPTIQVELESNFLSDTYFTELTDQYEKIRSEHRKWYLLDQSKAIASHAIVMRMMQDLTNNQALLYGHKNSNLFFDTFDRYVKKLPYITEEIHHYRNELNNYGEAPEELEEMIELAACGKWKVFSARYHRYEVNEYDSAYNVKFISSDGRFEVVYNMESGKMVTDPVNMGTYNFAPGSIVPWKYYQHHKYDKVPWKKWGNTDQVSYKEIIQRELKHGSNEQKNSSDELEQILESKSSEFPSC